MMMKILQVQKYETKNYNFHQRKSETSDLISFCVQSKRKEKIFNRKKHYA